MLQFCTSKICVKIISAQWQEISREGESEMGASQRRKRRCQCTLIVAVFAGG